MDEGKRTDAATMTPAELEQLAAESVCHEIVDAAVALFRARNTPTEKEFRDPRDREVGAMGYFPNGMSGEYYKEQYCDHCIHEDPAGEGPFCPIWALHLLHNYAECNKEESFLHTLIPRDGDGFNAQCAMFVERSAHTTKQERGE